VLGPTLYVLYTADIPTSTRLTTSTFADDTAILTRLKTPMQATAQLALHLVGVENWLSDWRIKVNEHPEQAKLPAAYVKQHSTPTSKRSDKSRSSPRQKTHMAPAH